MDTNERSSAAGSCNERAEAASSEDGSSSENGTTTVSVDDFVSVCSEPVETLGYVQDVHLNLLLVGDNGLGKTTFIRRFLEEYKVEEGQDPSSARLEEFMEHPLKFCTKMGPIFYKGVNLSISMQDTPGWSSSITDVGEYIKALVHFILQQEENDYNEFKGTITWPVHKMRGELKHTITACLYFLAPHDIKPVDLMLMSTISRLVSVIPIIAKADTLTDDEVTEYRQQILKCCSKPKAYISVNSGIEGTDVTDATTETAHSDSQVNVYKFAELSKHGNCHEAFPFTVITRHLHLKDSTCLEHDACGDCQRWQNHRSEFDLLKRLLLGKEGQNLLEDAWKQFVRFCGQYREAAKSLDMLVEHSCIASRAYLKNRNTMIAEAALIRLQEDHNQLQAKQETLLAEKKQLCERRQQLQDQVQSVERYHNQLQESHRQLQVKWEQAQQILKQSNKEYQRLQHEYQALQTAHVQQQSTNKRLQGLQEEHQTLQDSYRKLWDEHSRMKAMYQHLQECNEVQKRQFAEIHEDQQQSKAEWQQLHEFIKRNFWLASNSAARNAGVKSANDLRIWCIYKMTFPSVSLADQHTSIICEFVRMIQGWRYYQKVLRGPLGIKALSSPGATHLPTVETQP